MGLCNNQQFVQLMANLERSVLLQLPVIAQFLKTPRAFLPNTSVL